MKTQIKILAIVYRINNSKPEFLALRNNPKDPKHGGDFWYVVTGSIEGQETLEEGVKRELFEETGIKKIIKVTNTEGIFEYKNESETVLFKEHIFLVEVGEDVKKLNEENIEYEWLDANEFLKRIKWGYDFRIYVEKIITAHQNV